MLTEQEELKEDKQKDAGEEIDIAEILKRLKDELKEISRLLPKIDEKRERLERNICEEQEKIAEIENLIPKLEEKKKNLQESMKRKQEEISKIDAIKLILKKI